MDNQLKQRLVGAAVLVGLGVIFLPMLLDGPVDQSVAPKIQGVPLVVPEPTVTQPSAEPIRTPVRSEPRVEPQVEPKTAPQVPAPVAGGDWAVQLGSFSSSANATALSDHMRSLGFDSFVQGVTGHNGRMYRVRVGPVATREDAERLASRVRAESGEPAVVVSHP